MQPTRTIRTLLPRISHDEAIAALGRGVTRFLRGPLQRVAEVYLPFRFFEVDVVNRGRRSTTCYAADAVTGALDLFEFEGLPADHEVTKVSSANYVPFLTDEARALELIEAKVERAVFQAGFFRVRDLQVRAFRLPVDIHVPYWLGFFGSGEDASLKVLDAVRRQIEGAKARALFEDWLVGRLSPAHAGREANDALVERSVSRTSF
jgi:hypothetical protein